MRYQTVKTELGPVVVYFTVDGDVIEINDTEINGESVNLDEIGVRKGDGWVSMHDHLIDRLDF